jgi:hypothetical protein
MDDLRTTTEKEADDNADAARTEIDDRLRRAWLNGFREGAERTAHAVTETWGQWDA